MHRSHLPMLRCKYYILDGNLHMEANYKKLWKLLRDKDMKKTDLLTLAGINSNILAKMGRGEGVSMDSLQKVCRALDCDVGDIVELNERKVDEK